MLKFIVGVLIILIGFSKAITADAVWGLYCFALLSHVRLEQLSENYWLPLRVPIAIALLTITLYLFSPKYPNKFSRWPAEVWLMGIMLLGMVIGSLTCQFDHDVAWTLTFDFLKYWVFFILLIQMIDSKEKLEGFHWVLVLSAAWLVFRAWDLRGTTGLRFENLNGGNVADSNHFSAALVMLFPFVFQKTFSKDRRIVIFAALLCFGMVMAVFIAISRGGMLGLMALGLLILINFKKRRGLTVVILVALGITAFSFANESQIERLASVFGAGSTETRDASAQSRIDYWKLGYQLFKENPLAGVGPGNFPYYSGMRINGLPAGKTGQVTHSLWFELMSQGGILVTVPFLIMLLRFFRNSRRLARAYAKEGNFEMEMYVRIPMIALAAFLVPATFLDRSVYEPIYWCLGIGAIHQYLWKKAHPENDPLEKPGRRRPMVQPPAIEAPVPQSAQPP